MHISLQDIKYETFPKAEQNLHLIKALLDYEGAAEAFMFSPHFYKSGLNGS